MDGRVHIGTSGWVYPHWRDVFYPRGLPQSRWFRHYAEHFDTVEINNTFYRLPAETVFDRWREESSPGFQFAVKASRYVTHLKRLAHAADSTALILDRSRRLGDRLGPILYQLPPRWPADPARLEEFAGLLPADLDHVFEFRDASWFRDEIRAILEAHHLSFCLFDRGGLATPLWTSGRVAYVRFHGSSAPQGGYTPDELRAWADRVLDIVSSGLPVYAYFNNDAFGHAVHNALELRDLVGR